VRDERIAEAAAIGVPDRRSGERIAVFVVLREGVTADPAELAEAAVAAVGNSFAPTVHVVASLPKTTNGKIMRRAIRARHMGSPTGDLSSLDAGSSLDDIPVLGPTRAPRHSERPLAPDVAGYEVEKCIDRP
jgi:acetyl-CoA synthetase